MRKNETITLQTFTQMLLFDFRSKRDYGNFANLFSIFTFRKP